MDDQGTPTNAAEMIAVYNAILSGLVANLHASGAMDGRAFAASLGPHPSRSGSAKAAVAQLRECIELAIDPDPCGGLKLVE